MNDFKYLILICTMHSCNTLFAMEALNSKQEAIAKARTGINIAPQGPDKISLDDILALSNQGLASLFGISSDTFNNTESLKTALNNDLNQKAYKKTYFTLALRIHPDKNPANQEAAEAAFKKIGNFYDLLKESKVDELQGDTQSARSESSAEAYESYEDLVKAFNDYQKAWDEYEKAANEYISAANAAIKEEKSAIMNEEAWIAEKMALLKNLDDKNKRLAKKPSLPAMTNDEINTKISPLKKIKFENNKLIDTSLGLTLSGDPILYIVLLDELKALKIANNTAYHQFIDWVHTQKAKPAISSELHNILTRYPHLYWYVTENTDKTMSSTPLFMIWHMIENKNI